MLFFFLLFFFGAMLCTESDDVQMLHNTSPVVDLFKLSHDSTEKIMSVRRNRVLDSAEGSSAEFPVSSQDQPGNEPSKVRGTSTAGENVQT